MTVVLLADFCTGVGLWSRFLRLSPEQAALHAALHASLRQAWPVSYLPLDGPDAPLVAVWLYPFFLARDDALARAEAALEAAAASHP